MPSIRSRTEKLFGETTEVTGDTKLYNGHRIGISNPLSREDVLFLTNLAKKRKLQAAKVEAAGSVKTKTGINIVRLLMALIGISLIPVVMHQITFVAAEDTSTFMSAVSSLFPIVCIGMIIIGAIGFMLR